jgi:DNA-binding HxlR family transcriptional regulator
MKRYGQFCSMARALDLLGERWTLLVVRELLCGSRRFGDIQRGIPRISRTMLSARVRELADAGVIDRLDGAGGPEYRLTAAGLELAAVVRELGTWGQRWLPRELHPTELDARALVWDIHRRVRRDALPERPFVVRIATRAWLWRDGVNGSARSRAGSRATCSRRSRPPPGPPRTAGPGRGSRPRRRASLGGYPAIRRSISTASATASLLK